MKPKALVIHAAGTNRDFDACKALSLAGAEPEIVHINLLKNKEKNWKDYSILVIPGGFSYADALGAGKLFALDLSNYLFDELNEFLIRRKPIIGICNGFQALVKAGILPGNSDSENSGLKKDGYKNRKVTLTRNKQGRFECRNVTMIPQNSPCIWTKNLKGSITCPIAHGEGRFLTDSEAVLNSLTENKQIALKYGGRKAETGECANGEYPYNPNGSVEDIAGICDKTGLVLGLMPHPENNVEIRERDSAGKRKKTEICLEMWKAGVNYSKNA